MPPKGPVQRLFFVPDVHLPYADKRALRTAIQAMAVFQPDQVILLGDVLDCYPISFYKKFPGRKTMAQELDIGRRFLRGVSDLLPKARKRYVLGNHEDRWPNYILEKAPALFGIVQTLPELLECKASGWEVVPYKRSMKVGKLHVTHELDACGKNAVREARTNYESNVVIGHVHGMQLFYKGNIRGKTKVAASFGWLGDPKKVDYKHRDKAMIDYHHGFGIGYLEPNGNVHLVGVPIVNGACCIEGEIIRG